jgi:hypothetical protein
MIELPVATHGHDPSSYQEYNNHLIAKYVSNFTITHLLIYINKLNKELQHPNIRNKIKL